MTLFAPSRSSTNPDRIQGYHEGIKFSDDFVYRLAKQLPSLQILDLV